MTGPLAPFAAGFRARLREDGYTPLSAVNAMRLMAHVSKWLDANGLGPGDLTGERVAQYAAARRAEGRSFALLPRSVAPILAILADAGVLALEPPAAPASEQERLLAAFERYLLGERALAASTAATYVARARRFLDSLDGGGVSGLAARDVTRAVLAETAVVSPGSAQYFVAALRAFLRFCFLEGAGSLSFHALYDMAAHSHPPGANGSQGRQVRLPGLSPSPARDNRRRLLGFALRGMTQRRCAASPQARP